jgi:2-(1,2-epoxy-1,2-dihydrophenyl)acetyl-CoA isomerase
VGEPLVLTADDGPIWTVTINLPHKRNALDLDDRRALVAALRRADGCDGCRAVVLTGTGPVFCAGGDIAAMPTDPAAVAVRMAVLDELTALIVRNRKPVVAAVEGGAFGLGLSLAAACDTVVAAKDARFVASFGRLGLVADTGLHWSLAQRVGPARAKELILYGTELSATEAHAIGLVSRVVEPGTAAEAARTTAEAFLGTSPQMVALTKQIFAQPRFDLESVLEAEATAQATLLATPEFERRRHGFLAKRRAR